MALCICKKKGTDLLGGGICFNSSAPLFLLHRKYNLSTALIQNFKPLAISPVCVGPGRYNPKDRFSHYAALFIYEPRREKTGFLHMRKQRRRSASR